MRLLLVEDDRLLSHSLIRQLEKSGFSVDTAHTAKEATALGEQEDYRVSILDLGLPDGNGLDVLKKWRANRVSFPVLILTARDDWHDKVNGLKAGADDYLAKPFSARDVQARVKALLRRSGFNRADNPRFVCFDRWRLDTQAHELISDQGEVTPLSGADFSLLQLFLAHPNEVLDRDTISGVTRGRESMPLDRVVDVAVSRLRQRLGDQGRSPRLIKTVRGAGYLLAATVTHGAE